MKTTVICSICGAKFHGHILKKRCPDCCRKHHAEENRRWYAKKKAAMGEKAYAVVKSSVHMVNMPCPWQDGRLPASVLLNQIWG